MIQVSHEIPKDLFFVHDLINDYPYVLAHLLIKGTKHYDEEYASFYKDKLANSPYSILDNSCFELGASVDGKILTDLCAEYKPTHLVLPDIMGNLDATKELVLNFIVKNKKGLKGVELMGVLQGKTIDEYTDCLKFYNSFNEIDVIAINFQPLGNKDRREFIQKAHVDGLLKKKLHLLGCINPLEFKTYHPAIKPLIHSVDTSAPIIHGWNLNKFTYDGGSGNFRKPKDKLAENLGISLNSDQLETIFHNVKVFRSFIH